MAHRTSSRVLLIISLGVLLLVPAAGIAGAQRFSDVPPTDWAYEDVEWLAAAGVTNGCGDGTTFCPDDPVSRREMAAFLHRLATSQTVIAKDADTVDGIEAGELVSVYGTTGGAIDNFRGKSPTSILSGYVDTPRTGYLHITAVTNAGDDPSLAGHGWFYQWIYVDGQAVTPLTTTEFPACSGDGCGDRTTTMTAVVKVSADGHAIDIMAQEDGTGTYIYNTSLSTVFTPFGYVE